MSTRFNAVWTMIVALFVSMFLLTVLAPGEAFLRDAHSTALATAVLFFSLPLVESVLAGSARRPELAGVSLGLGLAFFTRQATVLDSSGTAYLAPGSQRILITAFVLSLALWGYRRFRSAQSARQSM